MTHILAIDQGTTSSRSILFDGNLRVVATAQEEFPQHYPASGWVEHDPSDLWSTAAGTARAVIEKAGINATNITAIGITNQRETTLIWARKTGGGHFTRPRLGKAPAPPPPARPRGLPATSR